MNILMIASWYPSEINSVSGIFIREQAIALKEIGVNVIVFYPFDKSLKPNEMVFEVENSIITYRANTDYLKSSKLSRINSVIKGIKFIDKIVKKHDIELIHAQVCYCAGFMAAFYKRKTHMPYVVTEHMSYIDKYNTKLYNRLMFKYSYSRADMVIPVSKALETDMKEMRFSFKSNIIGNVFNTDFVYLENNTLNTQECNILFVGFMSRNRIKGLEYLIPAFNEVLKKDFKKNIILNLAGDGELCDEYMTLCEKLGINKNVIFHGRLERSDLNKLMKNCDFLIVSSLKETFGSVLIEAMSYGLPVMSTRCGGPEDFINDEVGILVDKGNTEALSDGIEYMIKNLSKFDPSNIQNYAVNNFSAETIGNKIKDTYEDILKK